MWPWCCRPHPDTCKFTPHPRAAGEKSQEAALFCHPIRDPAGCFPAQGAGHWCLTSLVPLPQAPAEGHIHKFSYGILPSPLLKHLLLSTTSSAFSISIRYRLYIAISLYILSPDSVSISSPCVSKNNPLHPFYKFSFCVSTPFLVSECLRLYKELDSPLVSVLCTHIPLRSTRRRHAHCNLRTVSVAT